MLPEGTAAPAFTLPGTAMDRDATEMSTYSLTDALERGPVIINFYLFDFHPECTEHMCSLHDLLWFDLDGQVTVFGISTDRSFSHRAFADTEELAFALLSDSDGSVAESYDVFYEEFNGHKRIAKRSVFVVDTEGTIRYAWSTDDPTVQPDLSAVKDALEGLQTARADD
jgi:peroxiredoxin